MRAGRARADHTGPSHEMLGVDNSTNLLADVDGVGPAGALPGSHVQSELDLLDVGGGGGAGGAASAAPAPFTGLDLPPVEAAFGGGLGSLLGGGAAAPAGGAGGGLLGDFGGAPATAAATQGVNGSGGAALGGGGLSGLFGGGGGAAPAGGGGGGGGLGGMLDDMFAGPAAPSPPPTTSTTQDLALDPHVREGAWGAAAVAASARTRAVVGAMRTTARLTVCAVLRGCSLRLPGGLLAGAVAAARVPGQVEGAARVAAVHQRAADGRHHPRVRGQQPQGPVPAPHAGIHPDHRLGRTAAHLQVSVLGGGEGFAARRCARL